MNVTIVTEIAEGTIGQVKHTGLWKSVDGIRAGGSEWVATAHDGTVFRGFRTYELAALRLTQHAQPFTVTRIDRGEFMGAALTMATVRENGYTLIVSRFDDEPYWVVDTYFRPGAIFPMWDHIPGSRYRTARVLDSGMAAMVDVAVLAAGRLDLPRVRGSAVLQARRQIRWPPSLLGNPITSTIQHAPRKGQLHEHHRSEQRPTRESKADRRWHLLYRPRHPLRHRVVASEQPRGKTRGAVRRTATTAESPVNRCKSAVRARLKAPATAKFSGEHTSSYGGATIVSGAVDSQNAFGANLRSTWLCTIEGSTISVSFL